MEKLTEEQSKELNAIVARMKLLDNKDKQKILEKINENETLTWKCVIARENLTPQSTDFETICRSDLGIEKPLNETSGDGYKNDINYEIKASLHANNSKINFVQIRPDHDIHYYIFIAYNMYEDEDTGKGHIFKIPSNNVYELIVRYGGYAHGTNKELGEITFDNMKGRNCEYALRCDPNAKKGKSFELWNELLKHEVDYHPDNF
jgi:hypothetical protein